MLALLDKWQQEAKAVRKSRKTFVREGSMVKGHWRTLSSGVTVWIEEHFRSSAVVVKR